MVITSQHNFFLNPVLYYIEQDSQK